MTKKTLTKQKTLLLLLRYININKYLINNKNKEIFLYSVRIQRFEFELFIFFLLFIFLKTFIEIRKKFETNPQPPKLDPQITLI